MTENGTARTDATGSRYMTTIRVGPKGQIVIPKEARDLCGFQPGDSLLLLADANMGVALQQTEKCRELFTKLFPKGTEDLNKT